MLLFPIYAALVWYFAFRWRRNWRGFIAVALGVLAVYMLTSLIPSERERRIAGFGVPPEMHWLLYLEMLAVGLGGFIIACMPRGSREMDCAKCGYNLEGLDPVDLHCPECGALWRGLGSRLEHDRTRVPLIPIPWGAKPKKRKAI